MDLVKHINGVPTKLISFDHEIESSLNGVNFLVLVIPGNPGIIEFYRDFMDQLSLELKEKFPRETIPIWGISHAGHEVDRSVSPFPSIGLQPELYSLNGQIRHKEVFIRDYIPKHVKVIVIGHSIGCYITLQLLEQNSQFSSQVVKVFNLFPTIYRMRDSPNGKFYVSSQSLHWIPVLSLTALDYLPRFVRSSVVRTYVYWCRPYSPDCVRSGIEALLQKSTLESVLVMANCEMEQVYNLDWSILKNNVDRLFFYFGLNDNWCPLHFVDSMKEKIPNLKHAICTEGIEHAFVVKDSRSMASILIPQISSIMKEVSSNQPEINP